MSDYLYYCSNCNSLVADSYDDEDIVCDKCNGRMIPLHVDEDYWNSMSSNEKRDLIMRYRTPVVERKAMSRQRTVSRSSAGVNSHLMKCPNCGADIEGNSRTCSYCGAPISSSMRKEQEFVMKEGCPKCGSSNIKFERENQGEVRGKNSRRVIHRTVGFCRDCGYTWYPSGANAAPQNNNIVWWVLGWIFFFPAPVMVLIWRKKNTWDIKVKIAVTVVFWLFILIFGSVNDKDNKESSNNNRSVSIDNSELATANNEQGDAAHKSIYTDAEIVDLMNGFGTEKIGSISITKAEQSACTDEAIKDWYFNYVKKNGGCNYHLIVYTDNPGKGVYTMGKGFIQKDTALIAEKDGTYSLGDDAGSTYYTVDDATQTLTAQTTMVDSSVVDDVKAKVDSVIPDEYKNGKLYMVDIAGPEGELDCNLTLINENFASEDCQSIAVDLASKIKELDLGIGYFCIAFQSDDATLKAISNLDNLSTQDASEISTKEF